MSREDVLKAATQAVMQDRNADYAPPEQNFQRIADLWNTYLEGRDEVTPYDTAIMMVLVKVARIQQSPHVVDHLIDIAGYAACAGDVMPEPEGEDEDDDEEPDLGRRGTYDGMPGRLVLRDGSYTFLTDEGPKIFVTDPTAAIESGAMTVEP